MNEFLIKKEIKRPNSVKNKMTIPLAFDQIYFDWACL